MTFRVGLLLLLSTSCLAQCPEKDEYCISCAGSRCSVCIGTFVNEKGVCEMPTYKILRCVSYWPNGKCKGCKYGFFVNSEGICEPIPDSSCLVYDEYKRCVMCEGGVGNTGFSCSSGASCEDPNCNFCQWDDRLKRRECVRCKNQYTLWEATNGTMTCVQQLNSTANCLLLNSNDVSKCAVCSINYYFSNGQCILSKSYKVNMETVEIIKAMFIGLAAFLLG